MWEIEARRDLASLVPNDAEIVHSPENHTDTGTACTLGRRVSAETIHVRADITTVVRIPQRNGSPTMLPWTQ